MKQVLATDGPVLCDVRVTREENTYPMIAPGQAARDMVG
jgi:acetolactate synthase I/II/III large subunit